jgi:Putative Actinobacterial Holin-X, holin superfamily III
VKEDAMADVLDRGPVRPVAEQSAAELSTAELVQRASEQVSRLIRDELALARAELAEKGRHAGLGIGLFGGGGALAFFGLGTMVATAVLLLDLALPAWLAALVVTAVLFVAAAVLALIGRKQVRQAVPPVPQDAASGLRADVDAVTTALKGRSNGHEGGRG